MVDNLYNDWSDDRQQEATMPVIRISDSTFKKLQKLAVPLSDSHETVVQRLVDAALAGIPYQMPGDDEGAAKPGRAVEAAIPVDNHDDLSHTRIRSAMFDGVAIQKPNWNSFARHVHIKGYEQLGPDEFKITTNARIREGQYEKEGYVYQERIGISIQGMNSNASWENSLLIARKLDVPIEVVFEWYNNPKAAHPGETRTISWP